MKIKKILLVVLCLVLGLGSFVFAGCGGNGGKKEDLTIGISMPRTDAYNTDLQEKYEAYVASIKETTNIRLLITNADNKADKQLTDVENLITQNCDVIVVRAVDEKGMKVACEKVKKAGIKLVIDDTSIEGFTDYDARIAGDQLDHGKILGTYLKDLKTKGELTGDVKIGYIAGADSSNIIKRKTGISAAFPEVQFIAGGERGYVIAEKWTAENAQKAVETWMGTSLIEEMNVIACMNDEIANGAINAIKSLAKKPIVLGVDGSKIGQENIRNGSMKATTFQDSRVSAKTVIDTCVKVFKGETINFIDAGAKIVKLENTFLMTKETIDKILAG